MLSVFACLIIYYTNFPLEESYTMFLSIGLSCPSVRHIETYKSIKQDHRNVTFGIKISSPPRVKLTYLYWFRKVKVTWIE